MQIARGLQIGHVVGWPQGPPSKGPPPPIDERRGLETNERGGDPIAPTALRREVFARRMIVAHERPGQAMMSWQCIIAPSSNPISLVRPTRERFFVAPALRGVRG